MTMTCEINLRNVKVTNVQEWPNGLGVDATANGIRFEMWKDGRFKRVVGNEGTHYHDQIFRSRGSVTQNSIDLAKVAYALWMGCRSEWMECE